MRSVVLAAALLAVPGGRLAAEDWPQFRGPNCTGVSASKKALPLEFSPTRNVRWSAVLGDGIGSPAAAAGRVFSTGMSEAKGKEPALVVYAFDTSQILAQPVSGDGKIYVTGQDGKIAVLALEPKLKVLARNDMGEECVATPAIADGHLYIRTRTKLYCVGTSP
jgi:outer membrane protein assembly factor BamB